MAVPQVTTGFVDTTSPTIRKYIDREWVNVANPNLGNTPAQMLDQFNAQQTAAQAAAAQRYANGDRGAVPASMLTGGAQSGFGAQSSIDAANAAMQAYQLDPTLANAQALHKAFTPVNTPMERRGLTAKRDPALDIMRQQMIPIMGDAQQRYPELVKNEFGPLDALFLAATSAVGGAGLGGVLSGIGGLGTVGLTGATGAGSTMGGAAAYGAGAGLFGSGTQASMAGQDFTLKDALTGAGMGAITGALAHTATPSAPTAEFSGVTMPESSTILDNIAANATGNISPEAGGLAWGTNVVSPAAASSLGMAPSMVDSVNTMNMAPAISAANRTAPNLFTSLKNAWDSAPAGTADTLMSLFGGDTPAPQMQQPTAMPSMMQPTATSALSSAFNPVGGMNQQAGYDQEAGGSGMFGNLNLGVNPDITF